MRVALRSCKMIQSLESVCAHTYTGTLRVCFYMHKLDVYIKMQNATIQLRSVHERGNVHTPSAI